MQVILETKTEPRCKNCKYWERTAELNYGFCFKVENLPVNMRLSSDGNTFMGENFGCIHFEPHYNFITKT